MRNISKTIIEEYRKLTENIAVIRSCITSTKREKNKLIRENINIPRGLSAIDYSIPAVQTSLFQGDLASAYIKIHDFETELMDLEEELKQLYGQRDELERVINDLGDVEKKAMMLRIKGYTNRKISEKMHYSERQIERIFKNIREKQKDVGEMSV